MFELAGAFSSSNSRGIEDTVLLSASEMAIVGMITGREVVGAVSTVAVGMVAGMVVGGMGAGMAVGIAACMVMAGIVVGTVVEEGMHSAEADVVGLIGGRLGVGLRAPSVGYVECSSIDPEGTLPVLAFFDVWPTDSLRRLVCNDDMSEDSLFTGTS